MTFEEFLIKKKINPVQLKDTEQAFFDEFKSHFDQMGEISFDHSKKFWFNKLRRAYPLAEEVKIPVVGVKPVAEALEAPSNTHEKQTDALVKQINALEAPVADVREAKAKPTFKPRFKANIATSTTEVNQESQDSSTKSAGNKSNTNTTSSQTVAIEPSTKDLETKTTDAKPTFKPRFKTSMLKKDSKTD